MPGTGFMPSFCIALRDFFSLLDCLAREAARRARGGRRRKSGGRGQGGVQSSAQHGEGGRALRDGAPASPPSPSAASSSGISSSLSSSSSSAPRPGGLSGTARACRARTPCGGGGKARDWLRPAPRPRAASTQLLHARDPRTRVVDDRIFLLLLGHLCCQRVGLGALHSCSATQTRVDRTTGRSREIVRCTWPRLGARPDGAEGGHSGMRRWRERSSRAAPAWRSSRRRR